MPKWTADQEKAIHAKWRNSEKTESANILVNAAAGSGKTAVLVERIINKLCADPSSPDRCSAENLLVVTFTNAAAKEMQQRIYDALKKKHIQANEENDSVMAEYLKKQLSLIHSADITTIDAFCLKTIRSYFHLLNIDPDFRIADSAECEMLKDEAMEELFETYYGDEEFINLLCLFSDGRDDKGLSDLIKQIFEFTRSQPDPIKWLTEKADMLKLSEKENPYFAIVKKTISEKANTAMSLYKSALELMINTVNGTSEYINDNELNEYLAKNQPETENDIHYSFGILYKIAYNEYFLAKVLSNGEWNEMKNLVSDFKFDRINASVKPRDKEREIKDPEIISFIKDKRTAAKKIITDGIIPLLPDLKENIQNITDNYIYPTTNSLIKFCCLFEEIYTGKKNTKNIREFSDIEHLCLELFCNYPEVCEEFKSKYTEILMDEYQDSNALQEAIFEKISRGDNLFTVGDMKQSIYRFRSSDPDLFKNKCDTYSKEETAHDQKIVLSKNFRSRSEVLDGINSVFESIMTEDVGGVDYDDDQKLYCGDTSYEEKNVNNCGENKCECFVITDKSSEENDSISATALEARFIAKKIRELYDSKYLIRDKRKVKKINDKGEAETTEELFYRPVQFRDFAIITSSYKSSASTYLKELSACGIDCYAQTGGYFDRPEIKLALALLKTINNPYNDIPLIAVLRSPIFSFSDDDLCNVRILGTGSSFYTCLKSVSETETNISSKCSDILKKLEKWRYLAKVMPVDKLIWTLYEETSVYNFAEAVYGSDAATNLRLLFTRANAYESSGYRGLFNFIRYIGKMKKKETDLSSAVVVGENSDVVRLMTIHKSKGLEFPIVFLAGASKKFNRDDLKGRVLLHKELGFGMDYINFEKSFFVPSLQKIAVSTVIQNDMQSEEMRKLYVALTRAKEKLIVTAIAKPASNNEFEEDIPQQYMDWESSTDNNGKMKKSFAQNAKSFIDWVAPIAMRDNKNWLFHVVPYSEASRQYFNEQIDSTKQPISENVGITVNEYKYPHRDATILPVKISVTDIKNASGKEALTPLLTSPEFLKEKKGLNGAEKGTAVHYVMQKFVPFKEMTLQDVKTFISQLEENEELSSEEARSVDPNIILSFYETDLGQRIINSKKVMRETPFEIEISANSVYDINSDEKILLQGVIDCYFYEGDDVIIVDYKTDYYTDINEISQKYAAQLKYYKEAVEKISEHSVKNSYLYLFFTKSVIQY